MSAEAQRAIREQMDAKQAAGPNAQQALRAQMQARMLKAKADGSLQAAVSEVNFEPAGPKATPEEMRARIALRGLFGTKGAAGNNGAMGDADNEGPPSASLLHKSFRAEVDDVLKSGLRRRMERLERRVSELHAAGKEGMVDGAAPVANVGQSGKPKLRLQKSLDLTLVHADRCTRQPNRKFGPTNMQADHIGPTKMQADRKTPDPQENPEQIHDEGVVLSTTLKNLRQSTAARERQLEALRAQTKELEQQYGNHHTDAEAAERDLKRLKEDPDALEDVYAKRVNQRECRVQEIERNLERTRAAALRYKELVQQQRSFYTQNERVNAFGGTRAFARHPAGIVFLVAQPLSIADEKTEVWDVGNAIANPYVCDSWPFEPNVLARRSPQEGTMERLDEDTDTWQPEERDNLRRYRLPNLPQLPRRDDNDSDDDFDKPRSARSV